MGKNIKFPMSAKAESFYQQLRKAVETDQLKLPTLPEVALKIRKAVEEDHQSAQQISELLSQDPSLSARLLQLANSPLYRARSEIDNLHMAITRLGVNIVKDLVTTLAMRQVYHASSDTLEKFFRELWSTSVEVASISRTVACNQSNIEPEQALIAGLIHNIGSLPIVMLAEQDQDLIGDENLLNDLTKAIQNRVGEMILSFWNFPKTLVDVVSQWNNFHREHEGPADYVDVVQVAILHSRHTGQANAPEDWTQIPAFSRLSLDAQNNLLENEETKLQIENTRQSLIAL